MRLKRLVRNLRLRTERSQCVLGGNCVHHRRWGHMAWESTRSHRFIYLSTQQPCKQTRVTRLGKFKTWQWL